ncbi:BBE domain-containing protein [Georgenia yuyongxinii]
MLVGFAWAGSDHEAGAGVVAPLLAAAPAEVELVEPVPWPAWQGQADVLFPRGSRAYWKNTAFDRLDDAVIETIALRAAEQTWRGTGFDIHHMGGAYARVPEDATAFPTRAARFWFNAYGFWSDAADDADRTAFVRGIGADMEPFSAGAQYVNFVGVDDPADVHGQAARIWGPDKLDRLRALKRRYDPGNLFRLNHNIAPE